MYWRLDEMQLYIHSYFKLFILHVYFCNPHTKWLFQWLDLLFFCPKKLKQWKKRVLLKFLTCDIWYVYSRGIFFSLSYKRLTMFYIAKLCSDVGFFFTLLPWNGTVTKTVPNSSLRTAPRKISGSCVKWKKKMWTDCRCVHTQHQLIFSRSKIAHNCYGNWFDYWINTRFRFFVLWLFFSLAL